MEDATLKLLYLNNTTTKMDEIQLTKTQKQFLKQIAKNAGKKRKRDRAKILLLMDKGCHIRDISRRLGVHEGKIYRVRKRYLEKDLNHAINEKTKPGRPYKYKKMHRQQIIALAKTKPPKKKWTIKLLTKELRKKKNFRNINRETVRQIVNKYAKL